MVRREPVAGISEPGTAWRWQNFMTCTFVAAHVAAAMAQARTPSIGENKRVGKGGEGTTFWRRRRRRVKGSQLEEGRQSSFHLLPECSLEPRMMMPERGQLADARSPCETWRRFKDDSSDKWLVPLVSPRTGSPFFSLLRCLGLIQ